MNTKYLTIKDAAEILSCSEITVRRMINKGDLRAYRFGRMIRIKETDFKKVFKPVTNLADIRGL